MYVYMCIYIYIHIHLSLSLSLSLSLYIYIYMYVYIYIYIYIYTHTCPMGVQWVFRDIFQWIVTFVISGVASSAPNLESTFPERADRKALQTAFDSFQKGSRQTGSSQKCRNSPWWTFKGACWQHVATYGNMWHYVAKCGNMCALKPTYDNMQGICGTCVKTLFVPTPSGSL